jgi:hypothetical protein
MFVQKGMKVKDVDRMIDGYLNCFFIILDMVLLVTFVFQYFELQIGHFFCSSVFPVLESRDG